MVLRCQLHLIYFRSTQFFFVIACFKRYVCIKIIQLVMPISALVSQIGETFAVSIFKVLRVEILSDLLNSAAFLIWVFSFLIERET